MVETTVIIAILRFKSKAIALIFGNSIAKDDNLAIAKLFTLGWFAVVRCKILDFLVRLLSVNSSFRLSASADRYYV